MNNSIKSLVVLAIVLIAGTTFAQGNTSSATGTASANVICPISLSTDRALAFGNILAGTGTITVANTDNLGPAVYSSDAVHPGSQNGSISSAHFHVIGQSGYNFSITTPASTTVINGTSTLSVALSGSAASGTLSQEGGCTATADFWVGGTLTDSPTAASGPYTGSWSETVTYN